MPSHTPKERAKRAAEQDAALSPFKRRVAVTKTEVAKSLTATVARALKRQGGVAVTKTEKKKAKSEMTLERLKKLANKARTK